MQPSLREQGTFLLTYPLLPSPAHHNHRLRAKSPSAVTQNCDPPPSTLRLSKLGLERSNLISVKVSWLCSSPLTTETTVPEFPGKFQPQLFDTAIQHPLHML